MGKGPIRVSNITNRSLGLNLQRIAEERLWLHWGMSMLAYPFFYDVARTKLRLDYSSKEFETLLNDFERYLSKCNGNRKYPDLETQTLFEKPNLDRWILNKPVANAILDITNKIGSLRNENIKYSYLFKLALGTILISVSNVFRNGKCLSYKSNWSEIKISRKTVHQRFINHCRNTILIDLKTKEMRKSSIHNYVNFQLGDARKLIKDLPDETIDLVITSPPYLNSRDYTDIYRLELWILGYISKYEEERKIRGAALTSHVQIDLEDTPFPNIKELKSYLSFLHKLNGGLWNKNIPNMIKGYFYDIQNILRDVKSKLTMGAKMYINVSNSAYGGRICEVDLIISKIAQNLGYKLIEIRLARYIKSSSQQELNEKIRESIIVLEK